MSLELIKDKQLPNGLIIQLLVSSEFGEYAIGVPYTASLLSYLDEHKAKEVFDGITDEYALAKEFGWSKPVGPILTNADTLDTILFAAEEPFKEHNLTADGDPDPSLMHNNLHAIARWAKQMLSKEGTDA